MPVDLFEFHQKIIQYPEEYLLPQQEQALHIILETLDNLFGESISQLSHEARLQLVQVVIQACVSAVKSFHEIMSHNIRFIAGA